MSIVFALLLSAAAAAPDQAPAAAPAATEAPAKPAKEKKVCKVDPEADPASHMVKRICHTEQEWAKQGVMGSSRSGFSVSGDKYGDH